MGGEIVKTYTPARRELFSLSDPDAGTSSTEYDGFGQVRRTQDGAGNVSETSYDQIGRPLSKVLNGNLTFTTTYETKLQPAQRHQI